ncbi:MAG TPA: hypothetical protein VGV61_02015, partial [Thermoanaerobaculia bacterium]|nr:hypothetical protein [Thermoanaerobaculia bacterium]
MSEHDNALRQQLRRALADEAPAPPFARVWAAAEAGAMARRPPRRRLLLVAMATPVVIVALVLLARPAGQPAKTTPATAAALVDWRPATDFLLATPGGELLSEVPRLGVDL